MNNKGSAAFVYFMLGVIFFLLGLAIAPGLTETINESRDNLDCSNSSISNQDKSVCYQMDAVPALWIGIMFGLGGLILARMI